MAPDRRTENELPGLWSGPRGTPRTDDDTMEPLAALGPAVRALIRHVLGARGDDADVDDCTGEVFRRSVEYRGRLEPGAPLRLWVLGIARNVGLDARRARRRALARSASDRSTSGQPSGDGVDGEPSAIDRIADIAPGPERRVELAERTARLQMALAALPEEQRRAVLLHAEGFGYREIAERLAAPLGTICTWISRARKELGRALLDEESTS